jgi:hydrogenase/urease accessory protein HupE
MWLRLLLLFVLVRPAPGHPLDDASLEVRRTPNHLQVTWTVPPGIAPDALLLGSSRVQVQTATPLPSGHVRYTGTLNTTDVNFAYTAWPARSVDVPRCLLVVHSESGSVSAVLTPDNPAFQLDQGTGAFSFFLLGMEHIFTGFDHLLFLLVLLLPGGAARTHLQTITAFTLAHSLTLSLAVLGIVQLPSRPVEIVIALSIAVAALYNLTPRQTQRRWPIAFGFGLIHGLGFAGALQERGVHGSDAALPLVSFNLGVEAGQVLILLLALPLLWRIGANQKFKATLSIVTALLALYWTWQRW